MESEQEKLNIDVSFHFFSIDPEETKPLSVDGNSEMYSAVIMHRMSSKVTRELSKFGTIVTDGSRSDLRTHICRLEGIANIIFRVHPSPVIHFDESLVPRDMNELTFHVWHFHHVEVNGEVVDKDQDIVRTVIKKLSQNNLI